MAVTFVNCFEVPEGAEADFLARWQEVNDHMRAKEGYLEHQLCRALGEGPFRFVNVARWSSPQAFTAAHDDAFRVLVSDPAWARYPSTPTLCEVVHEGAAPGSGAPGSAGQEPPA